MFLKNCLLVEFDAELRSSSMLLTEQDGKLCSSCGI